MFYTKEDLQQVNRAIRQTELQVRQQERILTALRMHGQPTRLAERVLAKSQETLAHRRQHRDSVEMQLSGRVAETPYASEGLPPPEEPSYEFRTTP